MNSAKFDQFAGFLKSKFVTDSLYNIASIVLLAMSGIVINFLIAAYYGTTGLGNFNIVCTLYVIIAQVASMGQQYSCLKYIPELSKNQTESGSLIVSSLAITLTTTIIVCTLLHLSTKAISSLYNNAELVIGISSVVPALFCFPLNKVLFSIINGMREMKAFAAFTALRSLTLLVSILAMVFSHAPSERLTAIFSISEITLFLSLSFYILTRLNLVNAKTLNTKDFVKWMHLHLKFGLKSIFLGIMSETAPRLDILLLGYFLPPQQVGVYSYAAMLVEGFNQLPCVFRRNIDPLISKMVVFKQKDELVDMIKKGIIPSALCMIVVSSCMIGAYPLLIKWFIHNYDFMDGWIVFCILMSGATVQAIYIPFSGILIQSGYPERQTCITLYTVFANIIFNILLIPLFGIVGSSISGALTYFLSVYFLKKFSWSMLQIKI